MGEERKEKNSKGNVIILIIFFVIVFSGIGLFAER